MSFSAEIKQEIIQNRQMRTRLKKAHAYGLFLFSEGFSPEKISIHTENEAVAQSWRRFARDYAGRTADIPLQAKTQQGRALYRAGVPRKADRLRLLAAFSHPADDRFNTELLETNEHLGAFLGGAFLACGAATDPARSYQLEFVVRDFSRADRLAELLETVVPGVGRSIRRKSSVLYYKESARIEDLLTLMGASNASLSMIEVEIYKDVRNRANRATNCETANIDKQVTAAAQQMEDIRLVLDTIGEDELSSNLRQAAVVRLAHPELSLRELAAEMPVPISRSGLYHRLDKLSRMAAEIREKGEVSK